MKHVSRIDGDRSRDAEGLELAAKTEDPALVATIERFEAISRDLREGYADLAEHAERVEQELVRTNAELERRVAELDAVLEALPTGVLVRDTNGAVTRANRAALELLGGDENALLGEVELSPLPAFPTTDQRVELSTEEGAPRVVFTRAGAIREGRGTVQILDDRTALERFERKAAGNAKLAAIGTLAAGIAHEIRNPLNAIKGFAALLVRALEPGSKHARWAELSVAGCEEAEGIVSGLLNFADPGTLDLSVVDPRELVDAVLDRCAIPENAEVSVEIDAQPFAGDAIKLRQALRNLVENALQIQTDSPRVAITVEHDGDDLLLAVEDGGPGLDPTLVERVLEPFFTTRAEGTGLGLALCHTIARLHGGRLEPSPNPSRLGGAEFRLRIPFRTPDSAPDAAALAIQ
ncbi:MAG: two-component system sensor histidine kinase NtrB [Planctomycetota bacterium]|jgi:two-component system sensor histidine kinase FlrB